MIEILRKFFNIVFAYKTEVVEGKNPLKCKTFYVNLIALIGVILAKYLDFNLSSEETAAILVVINGFLRLISKGSVGFYRDPSNVEAAK